MNEYRKGIFIGRFQPFHIGHLHTIKEALKLCDAIVIGIGSSQEHGTEKNPLDERTRAAMISAALEKAGIHHERFSILALPDFKSDDEWFGYVMHHSAGIEVVFSDNPWVIGIFKKEGILTKEFFLDREHISATHIRELIRNGGDWKHLVPDGASAILENNLTVVKDSGKK
ncbi:MAG: nicotinamide-nucleotide adenylyltransferase [Candidatus Marsarchaeota archaeon]|nr:nicotinamide-nucleotide adenylyltransferase [Candidatus Marsarchaeota archaeon]